MNTISRSGMEKLQKELNHLKIDRRSEIAEKLKEARSFGDLSENAEYDEAKNEQGILESRIAYLEDAIKNSVVVEDDDISITEVNIGSIITVKDMETEDIEKYTIVGASESDFDEGRISSESPFGKAALEKKVGDIFEVDAPAGILKYELLEISK